MENKEKKAQLSFRLDKSLRNEFAGLVKSQGRDIKEVLEGFVTTCVDRKSIPNSDKSPVPADVGSGADNTTGTYHAGGNWLKDSESPKVDSVQLAIQSAGPKIQQETVTKAEWRWVQRLLKVLRGGQEKATKPLDTNLDAFVILTDLLTAKGEHGGSDPTVSRALPQPDTRREVDALRNALKGSGEHVDRTHEAATRPRKARKNPKSPKAGNQ